MPTRAFSTKDRILDAAERLFALHGFAGTSLRQITSLAEVNSAAVAVRKNAGASIAVKMA